MKNLYIFLILTAGFFGFGQNSAKIENNSPSIFDNSIDKYGTKYKNSDIITGKSRTLAKSLVTNTLLCSSGIFNLYFETGSGM